jgi:transposase-like protein
VIESLRADAEGYSIVECCRALGVSRSGLYRQWSKNNGKRKSQDAVIGQSLREHFAQSRRSYGWPLAATTQQGRAQVWQKTDQALDD